jgi:RecB family exonuclease
VREHLHERGFADEVDMAEAATAAARARGATEAIGAVVCLDLGAVAPAPRRVLDLLAPGAGGRPGAAPAMGTPPFTEVRPCVDPAEEVRTAVRAVVGALERGVPLWGQAVLHPPGPSYSRALHQELAGAGVAANGPDLRRLDRSVAGGTLLRLLEMAGTDWARDEVMAWLSTAPIVAGRDRHEVPASQWDALSAEAGVLRGTAQWARRLGTLAGRQTARAGDAGALADFVDGLVRATAPPAGSWAAHAAWAVGLVDRYLDTDAASWPADEAAAGAQVRGTLLALGELDAVSDAVDLGTFRRAVRAALEDAVLDGTDLPEGGFGDGVFVAPFGRARGLRFDSVVLVGLADAVVPGGIGDDALLSEDVRRLDASGGLRTRAARLEEMHDDLRGALRAGGRRRLATYPRVDPRSGRAQVPSRWLAPLTAPSTRWRPVDSFAAAVAGADPPLSGHELALHDIASWADAGGDPARSPVALASAPLPTRVTAARDRGSAAFTRFDGYVGPGLVTPFSADAPVSATRLETYAKCPRRFLYERVLGVSTRTLPEEIWRMEPAPRGTLVHAILEDYLLERLAGAGRSVERLMAVADGHFGAAEEGGLVGRALLWRMDKAAIRRDLRRFHDEEGDLEPLAAELEFGNGDDDAAPPVTVDLGPGRQVRFKGKADRVDRSGTGELVVSDYKTGKQRVLADLRKDPVAGGRLLQLPIYAMAAGARFGDGGPVQARYWLLSEQRSAPSYDLELTDDVQARFTDIVGLISDAVEAGAFPGAPTEKPGSERQFDGCRFCEFDTLCPATRDRQWARKSDAAELAPVRALIDAATPRRGTAVAVATEAGPEEVP